MRVKPLSPPPPLKPTTVARTCLCRVQVLIECSDAAGQARASELLAQLTSSLADVAVVDQVRQQFKKALMTVFAPKPGSGGSSGGSSSSGGGQAGKPDPDPAPPSPGRQAA